MQNSILKRARLAAMLLVVLTLASSALASVCASPQAGAEGIPWQVGDVAACSNGTCNMIRISGTNAALLDQFSDNLFGMTNGAAINNTMHLLVTDDQSIVEYSIASLDPLNSSGTTPCTLAHVPVTTFSGPGSGILAVAVNNAGDMILLNSNGGSPTITELDSTGAQVAGSTITLNSPPNCNITSVTSMDLSADGLSAYVTSGGTIQQVTLASGVCTKIADFGSGVTLSGIKDIPKNALPSTCGSSITPSGSCPTGETLLVAATGTIDPSANENVEGSGDDQPDAVNVCTDAIDNITDSCALLLDASGSGLTDDTWIAKNTYFTLGKTIIDPFLHLRAVFTTGTSGGDEPNWTANGGRVTDNAVVWADQGFKPWHGGVTYTTSNINNNNLVVDTGFHVQQVQVGGISGASQPPFSDSPVGGGSFTYDNAVTWTNQGMPSMWGANSGVVTQNEFIIDTSSPPHVQQATNNGTSGVTEPTGCQANTNCIGQNTGFWSNTGGTTNDGSVVWIDRGVFTWQPTHGYHQFDAIQDSNMNIEQVVNSTDAGTSADTSPALLPGGWNPTQGQTTPDGLKWLDLGGWQADHQYLIGDVVGDPSQHLQQVCAPLTVGCPAAGGFGISGHTAPSAPNNPWNDAGGVTIDGLQWSDQNTAPAVKVRYPITGVNSSTVTALALDPLITGCSGGGGTACQFAYTPAPKLQNPDGKVNFWMGDSSLAANFYRVNFGDGTNTPFSANAAPSAPITLHNVQGLVVFGAEGANQPGLAKLFTGSLANGTNSQTVDFLQNPLTTSIFNSINANQNQITTTPFTIYASLVPSASDFTDPPPTSWPVTAPLPMTVPCKPTTLIPNSALLDPSNCVLWKLDVSPNYSGGDYLSLKFAGPVSSPFSIDTNTDGFTDMAYDTTVLVGNFDPILPPKPSVQGLFEISPAIPPTQSHCAYGAPKPSTCFQNPGTIPIKYSCSVAPQNPKLYISQTYPNIFPPQSATFPPVVSTTGTTNYTVSGNTGQFDWVSPRAMGTLYFTACTKDNTSTPQVGTFCVSFIESPKCPTNPLVRSISPNSGGPNQAVTITGANFASGAKVTFAGVQASVSTLTSTSIMVTTPTIPSTTPQPINVTVTNKGGLNGTLVNGYTYTSF